MKKHLKGQRFFSIILASSSERRIDLLKKGGIEYDIAIPPEVDEKIHSNELPKIYAKRMAYKKAKEISKNYNNSIVLAADTVVGCGRKIFPKTDDFETAYSYLSNLSGRSHKVYGGICMFFPDGTYLERMSISKVFFKKINENEKIDYLKSNEWIGMAGGYAIQGIASVFVKKIIGSYTNIVGIDIYIVKNLFSR